MASLKGKLEAGYAGFSVQISIYVLVNCWHDGIHTSGNKKQTEATIMLEVGINSCNLVFSNC